MKHGIQKTSTLETAMREYALTLAQPSLNTALIPLAVQCFKTAMLRRNIKIVLRRNGTCPATGLAGAELRQLLKLPLSCDIAMEIERIKFLNTLDQCHRAEVGTN
jgi:hypothetical protein